MSNKSRMFVVYEISSARLMNNPYYGDANKIFTYEDAQRFREEHLSGFVIHEMKPVEYVTTIK